MEIGDINVNVDSDIEYIQENEEEICRLCAKRSKNYIAIFGDNNFCVPEKISRCLPIIVLSNDKLPLCVCKYCLYCLNISYRLILTSMEADTILRRQLEETQEVITIESKSTLFHKDKPKYNRSMTIKELKRKAIAGPTDCEFCFINFQDIDEFDNHMETVHFYKWRCNLCDNSFQTSADLISHKIRKHNVNILTCNTCTTMETKDSKTQLEITKLEEEIKAKQEIIEYTNAQTQISNEVCNISEIYNIPEENDKKGENQNTNHTTIKRFHNSKKNQSDKTKTCIALLCNFCKIYFGDERHFTAHRKIHEAKHIMCMACNVECPTIYDLFLHKRTVHNMYKKVQLKYVCEKCGKFFTNSWQWQSHKGNVCPKKMFDNSCKYCKSIFSTNHKLMRHLRKHKTEMFNDPTVTIYKCIACPKIFVDKEFYQKHRNVHDPECWDKFKCTVCNRPFRDNVRLREHQLYVHEGVKPHQCDICGRTFHRLYNMKVHRATHFGRKCHHCDLIFDKLRDLIKHIKDEHKLEPDIETLTSRNTYKNNIYVCRYCGKKLASYQSLVNHEYIHTGEKPYSCKICHKTFRSYTSRWAHMQRHQKGNFVCGHCGKSFSYKQNLSIHVRTHLPIEDRKHQCSTCGKKFLRKCHLNIHMRIHNGIRPYTCDICLFSFTQKGDMRRHRMRHSKGLIDIKAQRHKPIEETAAVIKTEENTN